MTAQDNRQPAEEVLISARRVLDLEEAAYIHVDMSTEGAKLFRVTNILEEIPSPCWGSARLRIGAIPKSLEREPNASADGTATTY